MKRLLVIAAIALGLTAVAIAQVKRTASPAGAELYFIVPANGATVTSPVAVKFGLKGMGIAPAGIAFDNSGHHHLIVDAALPALNAPIPANGTHLHFGKGQTETMVELTPGTHTLQLVLGDQLHMPHDPAVVSKQITVMVK